MFISSSIVAVATIWFCMLLHYNHKLKVALQNVLDVLDENGLIVVGNDLRWKRSKESYDAEYEAYATEETV